MDQQIQLLSAGFPAPPMAKRAPSLKQKIIVVSSILCVIHHNFALQNYKKKLTYANVFKENIKITLPIRLQHRLAGSIIAKYHHMFKNDSFFLFKALHMSKKKSNFAAQNCDEHENK